MATETSPTTPLRPGMAALFGLICAIPLSFATLKLSTDADDINRRVTVLSEALIDFEAAIGYGGLIHDFKNFLLRPDERHLRLEARGGLAAARIHMDTIEEIGRSVGATYDLSPARETLEQYGAMLQRIDEMAATGAPARVIDRAVRIDDTRALAAISATVTGIRRALVTHQIEVERRITAMRWTFALLAVVAYGTLGWELLRLLDRQDRQGDHAGDPRG